MARRLLDGTPTRTSQYIFPSRSQQLLLGSAAAGGVLAVALLGLWAAGVSSVLSPGPVAAPHAPIGADCVLCHTVGAAVEDIRCERCHDAGSTLRLTNQAHVLFGSGDAAKAQRADSVACITCHTDHRGRDHELYAADDRECATCHEFGTLRRHPEFAAVTAGRQTGLGMEFPHERHLAPDAADGGCAVCHVPTPDLLGFEPISFDLHCDTCHTAAEGRLPAETRPIPAELLVAPEDAPLDPGGDLIELTPQVRRRVVVTGMSHRDPWVTYNAIKLRREIDPLADRAERAVLESQRAWLEQQLRARPLRDLGSADLAPLRVSLAEQIASLRERVAAAGGPATDPDALDSVAATTASVAESLGAVGSAGATASLVQETIDAIADLRAELEEFAAGPAPEESNDPDPQSLFEARRQQLLELLEAIAARGDEGLADRAGALRGRVEELEFDDDASQADIAALQQQLDALDEALRVAASLPDLGARYEAARIDVIRKLARQRVGGGLSPRGFETRREELLDLLDVVERRGGDAVALGAAQLRQQAIALRPGDSGTDGLERRLRDQQRLLARVELEEELEEALSSDDVLRQRDRPLAFGSQRDGLAIQAAIEAIDDRLRELRRGPRSNAAALPEERAARSKALQNLLGPCLKCHELSGSKLDPVQIARPVMQRSVFNHAPHVTQVSCGVCHGDPGAETAELQMVFASKLASDVNVPGVANCRTCHTPSAVSSDCETCHRYHPPSITSLLNLR